MCNQIPFDRRFAFPRCCVFLVTGQPQGKYNIGSKSGAGCVQRLIPKAVDTTQPQQVSYGPRYITCFRILLPVIPVNCIGDGESADMSLLPISCRGQRFKHSSMFVDIFWMQSKFIWTPGEVRKQHFGGADWTPVAPCTGKRLGVGDAVIICVRLLTFPAIVRVAANNIIVELPGRSPNPAKDSGQIRIFSRSIGWKPNRMVCIRLILV